MPTTLQRPAAPRAHGHGRLSLRARRQCRVQGRGAATSLAIGFATPRTRPPDATPGRAVRGCTAGAADDTAAAGAQDDNGDAEKGDIGDAVPRCKRELLAAIAAAQRQRGAGRQRVLDAARALEDAAALTPGETPFTSAAEMDELHRRQRDAMRCVSGRWSLVYSTQVQEQRATPERQQQVQPSSQERRPLQQLSRAAYSAFFRFAPFLAGSQDARRPADQQAELVKATNEQVVQLEAGAVENIVELTTAVARNYSLLLRVFGEVQAREREPLEVEVTFTSASVILLRRSAPSTAETAKDEALLFDLQLPLPRPVGVLRTTFCDDALRLARGSRGGLFITARLPATTPSLPQRLARAAVSKP
mmetsp:Transcript_1980/g.7085  ORF Transcript_1980/g.7085 Transcript_1980/m.7085 type:complete len:362 (+) Transcript_1980:132-1217(+)